MCLGIPGKLLETYEKDNLPMGKADFGGVVKEVCLAYTPEAKPGEYVLVHVGFALSRIDEAEAAEIFSTLAQMEALAQQEESGSVPFSGPPSGDPSEHPTNDEIHR